MAVLGIKVIILMMTLQTVDDGVQQLVAPMSSERECLNVSQLLINDEEKNIEAESKMEEFEIEPRTKLIKSGCASFMAPFKGQST